MTFMTELAESVSRVEELAGPSVVRIGRDGGRGAGFVFEAGHVVTSAHNLRGPQVTVTFPDGRVDRGEVRAADAEGDLAVVAADTSGTRPIPWAEEPPGIVTGQAVFALGPVPGASVSRVTVGFVSAVGVAFRGPRGRLITHAIEHTAPVGRGSSGGPVVDGDGSLLGVNTHRPGAGLYLAIPADGALRERVAALSRGVSPTRRRLGVALAPPHVAQRLRSAVGLPQRDGLLVREVGEGTPAADAGIQRGDLIVAVGGVPIAGLDDLASTVEATAPGTSVVVTVVRGAEEVTVEVRFEP